MYIYKQNTKTMAYKFISKDRTYTEWSVCDSEDFKTIDSFKIDPVENKLFNQDIFDVTEEGTAKVLNSVIRTSNHISAVLMIANKKTFGKHKNRNLYKCVPDDVRIPIFLVPYEIKNTGFSKVVKNKYVIISFDNWDNKHPIGKIQNTIGDVDKLENFYEYTLYCKSLYASIQQFTKDTYKSLKAQSTDTFIEIIKNKYNVEDRTQGVGVYTIDPETSRDFDDAYSIMNYKDKTMISIYISNVSLWMEELKLWDSFSERISTIYLPDKKRPMLPTVLSECLCSLQENEKRFAFTLDICIDGNEIVDVSFKNSLIKVKKNMRYDTKEVEEDPAYNLMLKVITKLNSNKKYKYTENITTSHDVIAYLMILMNYYSSRELLKYKCGIFRNAEKGVSESLPETLPKNIHKFLTYWKSSGGIYAKITEDNISSIRSHELLNLESYVHITSPIRRLVDLLNIIQLQECSGMIKCGDDSKKFYEKWTSTSRLDYINRTMRVIKKVQCSCNLLELCTKNPEVTERSYQGYIFDKISRTDQLYQYVVYIDELKIISKFVSRHQYDEYTDKKFKLYVFNDEERFKRKIRIMMVD